MTYRARDPTLSDRMGLRLYAMDTNEQAHKTYAHVGMHKTGYEIFEEMIYVPA